MSRYGRQNKYGAKSVEIDGHRFMSKREALRYGELKLLEIAGRITELKLQPVYPICKNEVHICNVILDFSYRDPITLALTIEDVKGMDTPISRLKRKLLKAFYDLDVEILK